MRRLAPLAGIGLLAGLLSGLFGVGGGVVMVPLLLLAMRYEEREATGTSLLAIVIAASAAVLAQSTHDTVHVDKGLLLGIPAVAGVLAGTWLQQRTPGAVVRLGFAALLVVTAGLLVAT